MRLSAASSLSVMTHWMKEEFFGDEIMSNFSNFIRYRLRNVYLRNKEIQNVEEKTQLYCIRKLYFLFQIWVDLMYVCFYSWINVYFLYLKYIYVYKIYVYNKYIFDIWQKQERKLVQFNAAIKNNFLIVIHQALYKMNKIIDINEIIVSTS